MSDFLISPTRARSEQFASILSRLTGTPECMIDKWDGEWGSLAVPKNHYQGFGPYETGRSLSLMIGGPLLRVPSTSEDVPRCSRHTATVLNSVFNSTVGDWHNDLLGPFCFLHVDKATGRITVVTDNMSFIPVYIGRGGGERAPLSEQVLSTHADAAAMAVGADVRSGLDPVSVCDLLLHKKVTYPYTLYKAVAELAPATVHTFLRQYHRESTYWRPTEHVRTYHDIRDAARDAREALKEVVGRAADEYGRLCFLLSAGEDSRTLASMAPQGVDLHCITIAPSRNREARIAQRIAIALKASWEFVEQPPRTYLCDLGRRALFSGSQGLSIHAHMLGIVGNSSLAEHPVVIGGFSANAFLKGHFYSARQVVPGIDFFRFEERAVSDNQPGGSAFDDEILAEVRSRRLEHADRLRAFRVTGINEWMSCWPMSQDHEIVNLWSNRRLFASLEAFMCPTILEIAASIPAEWVMNRRLFQAMAGPHLRKTGWFPHGNGHFPALPWYANVFMRPMVRVGRRLLRLGRREQNPYAWPSVAYCVSLPSFRELVNQLATTVCTDDPMIRRALRIAECDSTPAMQRFAAAQFLASFRELGEIRSSELISRQALSQLS